MIISHKHKFIFLKSTKTASTSIEVSLASVCGEEDVVTPITYEGLDPSYRHPVKNEKNSKKEKIFFEHMRPCEIYKLVDKTIWENYTKIVAIRNPWDRVISHAFMKYSRCIEKYPKAKSLDLKSMLSAWTLGLRGRTVEGWYEIPGRRAFGPTLLYEWVNLKKVLGIDNCIDFFIRFEDLNKDFSELCQRLNIDPIELPFAKGNFRTERKHYTEYFDAETRGIVSELYRKDIEMFEYKFEN